MHPHLPWADWLSFVFVSSLIEAYLMSRRCRQQLEGMGYTAVNIQMHTGPPRRERDREESGRNRDSGFVTRQYTCLTLDEHPIT